MNKNNLDYDLLEQFYNEIIKHPLKVPFNTLSERELLIIHKSFTYQVFKLGCMVYKLKKTIKDEITKLFKQKIKNAICRLDFRQYKNR